LLSLAILEEDYFN